MQKESGCNSGGTDNERMARRELRRKGDGINVHPRVVPSNFSAMVLWRRTPCVRRGWTQKTSGVDAGGTFAQLSPEERQATLHGPGLNRMDGASRSIDL